VLPVCFTIMWLMANHQLPGNDASNYLATAISIFQQKAQGGFFSLLQHAFTERGWRPIFFPDLAVPFLLIFEGNLYLAYACTAILSLVAALVYIYLFLRLR